MSDHVAIMRKSWKLIPKILNGRKTIESRWSRFKIAPWGRVRMGDRVFFKNSGEKVSAMALVAKVLQFEKLTPVITDKILHKYGGEGKVCLSDIKNMQGSLKNKSFCTLIFLEKSQKVRQFAINKEGFGIGAAWMCVGNINNVKK